MKRIIILLFLLPLLLNEARAVGPFDNPDTIVVSRDGTGQFRNIDDAIEVCRAFMDYHKVILVKKGIYKEKLEVPSWLNNIEILGEDRDQTVITWDDHANILLPGTSRKMGTFRTYTMKICGNNITLKNITIENNAARLGQAVALHTEGNRLQFVNCRFLGHQDTVYTGKEGTMLYFHNCYIEGTTDFIFGPSTVWFEGCEIHSRANSYVTAASTPADIAYGYVFNNCTLTADDDVDKVYLGRPWRPYAYTLFMNCNLGKHILAEGWENWRNPENEKTARYSECNSKGEGASTSKRVTWAKTLTKKEAIRITPESVFNGDTAWIRK